MRLRWTFGSLAALGILLFTVLFWGRPAAALPEDEWLVGLEAAGALIRANERWSPGTGGAVVLEHGLTDVWAARAALGFDAFRIEADPAPSSWRKETSFSLGAAAAFDVLRVVPFAEAALVIAHVSGGGAKANARAGLELGVGAEYLLDERWSVGLALRGRGLPVDFGDDESAARISLTAAFRLAHRF
jgi:hypothetical protein